MTLSEWIIEATRRAICCPDGCMVPNDENLCAMTQAHYSKRTRAAVAAMLKTLLEAGPNEAMQISGVEAHAQALRPFEDRLRAVSDKGWLALATCSSGHVTAPTFEAMLRALLSELELEGKEGT